jgi:glutamine synthetase
MPRKSGEALSPTGLAYLAGLLEYAVPSTVFATPTVNGYRRLRPNSLAPDRATWACDHRGAMIRVLGGAGDAATRIENRVGEPAANPYLYILSQVIAGRAGIEAGLQPPAPDHAPYAAERPMLPKSLPEALAGRARQGAVVPSRTRRYLHRLLRQAQANGSRQVSELARGNWGLAPKR